MNKPKTLDDLGKLATHLRKKLNKKKYLLLFAYNGIGKTRLSMRFKDDGKKNGIPDTLYFNAFTEDLFNWDNDLDNDTRRVLKLNLDSLFFAGLQGLAIDIRIRELLHRYADFDFKINTNNWTVSFKREVNNSESREPIDYIKISRGEEAIFVWCFFLAIAELAIDGYADYEWVKYIYIDDPISSLDDNNAIAVANHLAQLLKKQDREKVLKKKDRVKAVISSHHTLFFNVMCNELKGNSQSYFLSTDTTSTHGYTLRCTGNTPLFQHVALLKQLHEAVETGNLYTYHFNILRNLLEKTATFHGLERFSDCIKNKENKNDHEYILHARMINVLSHGNHSLFEPMEMSNEHKQCFGKILRKFKANYRFNPDLFPEQIEQTEQNSEEASKS